MLNVSLNFFLSIEKIQKLKSNKNLVKDHLNYILDFCSGRMQNANFWVKLNNFRFNIQSVDRVSHAVLDIAVIDFIIFY